MILNQFKEKWIFAIASMASGIPIWFTSYQTYTKGKMTIVSEVLIFLIATFFSFYSTGRNKIILFTVAGGFILAIIVKIVIDIFADPGNHNLWPFELILYMMLAFIFTGVGIGFGWGMKKMLTRN